MAQPLFAQLAPFAIVGLEGPMLAREERRLLSETPPAGVILFARNVESARQLRKLTGEVGRIVLEARGKPPIIAADHEGGVASVLADAIGTPPSQMAVGRAGDISLVGRLFAENARRMLACGINMMLGPVADINSERLNPIIGTRSFGESVETVSRCVSEAVVGARSAGILACLKHFPGHGPTRADSHLTLPVLEATRERLKTEDCVPFVRGFTAGAESVMVGHIVPKDRSLSASLDPDIVTGMLRGELGFDGVAMTDALEMMGVKLVERLGDKGSLAAEGASESQRSLAEICRLALKAGSDILLFSKPIAEVFDELGALNTGEVRDEFCDAELAACLKAASVRIDRLIGLIRRKHDRSGAAECDDELYRQIAASSVFFNRLPDASTPLAPYSGFGSGFEIVFWAEEGIFERPPVKAFVARVLDEFGTAMGSPRGRKARNARERSPEVSQSAAARRSKIAQICSDLVPVTYSFGARNAVVPEVVFLLNRKPLKPEAVKEICSGTCAVVVGEWPYAAASIDPGKVTIVTYGIYESAAGVVCSRLLKGVGR